MSGSDSLRAVGLMVDGPVVWGSPVRSRHPGIFVVESPVPLATAPIDIVAVRGWVERVPTLLLDGERPQPTALADRLASFWMPMQAVLYVGHTTKSLGARVAALYATRLGDRRPHPGGHWLRTLRGLERLRIWWAETDAPEEYEDALLSAFAETVDPATLAEPAAAPILPFGNLGASTGERRRHGMEGSLVDASPTTPPAGAGPSSPKTRRKSPAPRATGVARKPRARAGEGSSPPRSAPTRLSEEGLARLETELDDLRSVQRPQVITRVAAARQLGDLRENADYEAARNEQSFLEGRIRSLEALLATAEVIQADHSGEVMLGSTVELDHDGGRITYRIVGSAEASPGDGRISNVSPVGKALVGHRAGEEVVVQMPGRELRYRIVDVR